MGIEIRVFILVFPPSGPIQTNPNVSGPIRTFPNPNRRRLIDARPYFRLWAIDDSLAAQVSPREVDALPFHQKATKSEPRRGQARSREPNEKSPGPVRTNFSFSPWTSFPAVRTRVFWTPSQNGSAILL